MAKFAKLFDVGENDQMLYTLDYNEEKDNYMITGYCEINGVRISMSAQGMATTDIAQGVLQSLTQEAADSWYEDIKKHEHKSDNTSVLEIEEESNEPVNPES